MLFRSMLFSFALIMRMCGRGGKNLWLLWFVRFSMMPTKPQHEAQDCDG